MHIATRLAGAAAGLTLSIGALALPAGSAAAGQAEPCAQQQAQVDRAANALERLTAVFERQQTKVEKAKDRAEAADTAHERNRARKAVTKAKDARDEAKKDKKAQVQRLAKAQERLEECQAEQPTEG